MRVLIVTALTIWCFSPAAVLLANGTRPTGGYSVRLVATMRPHRLATAGHHQLLPQFAQPPGPIFMVTLKPEVLQSSEPQVKSRLKTCHTRPDHHGRFNTAALTIGMQTSDNTKSNAVWALRPEGLSRLPTAMDR
jgi:hypothetical protein